MENTKEKEKGKPQRVQRKQVIVKKDIQYTYIALVFFSALIAFILSSAEIVWFLLKTAETHPELCAVIDLFVSAMPMFLIKAWIYFALVVIVAVVISHRLAGPIFKFEKICAMISDGDLTGRVYLRKGDKLTGLQYKFNHMMSNFHSVVTEYEAFREEAAKTLPEDSPLRKRAEDLSAKIKGIMPGFKIK